nr:tRNA (adenosine(37)-N6)-dimethylallyltransferase MiaA [Thermoleophilaceae bacterium]
MSPEQPPRVVAIFGPTGVGKTAVAVALAPHLERPIAISADALQVYEGLGTLTGAASAEEQALLEHRLIGYVPVTEEYSAGAYAKRAHAEIDEALAQGRTPIVVGGTGLYLRAALTGLDLRPPVPPEVRERIEREMRRRGPDAMHAELAETDRVRVAPADRKRITRLLELAEVGAQGPEGDQLWTADTRHPTVLFGLTMERDALDRRIDTRMTEIFAAAREKVERAEAAGASRTARSAVGYEDLLKGDLDALKRRARKLARRQLTWMRKLAAVQLVDMTEKDPAEGARAIAG